MSTIASSVRVLCEEEEGVFFKNFCSSRICKVNSVSFATLEVSIDSQVHCIFLPSIYIIHSASCHGQFLPVDDSSPVFGSLNLDLESEQLI